MIWHNYSFKGYYYWLGNSYLAPIQLSQILLIKAKNTSQLIHSYCVNALQNKIYFKNKKTAKQ